MKAFMRLDPKFKTFEALDPEEFELDAEVAAYKQRMSRVEDKGCTVSQEDRLQARADL